MVTIREVKIEDWEKLRELLIEVVNEMPPIALELEPLIYKGKKWLEQFPKGELGYFVVAQTDHKIIGFCYLAVSTYYKPIAYIGVVVEKKHRREGLASRMFYEVVSWAAAEHLQYIIADVWSWNLKSLKFFEHLGFVEKTRFEDKFRGEEREKVRLVKKL